MIDVFNAISQHIVKGVMFHEQMADYFDFLNLQGLKRWSEYQFLCEGAELRGIHRYAINHLNRLVKDENIDASSVIPSSWFNATKMQVDNSTRKQAVKDAFDKWFEWEKDTKEFYEQQFKVLTDNAKIAEANKVNELICDVDHELKCVTRKMLEYKSVEWSLDYIVFDQKDLHEKYEKQTQEMFKVQMC